MRPRYLAACSITDVSRTWLVSTYGASVSRVRCGSSMVHSGLPESRHEPTKSLPASSMSIFTSRACMSPAWFSMATFNPASMMRDRTLCSTCTVFSMLASSGVVLVRSAEVPSTQRTMREPTMRAAAAMRVSCSSAVPFRLVENRRGGANREHADLDFDAELLGMRADRFEILLLQAAEESDLAEMDHANAPLRGEVEVLKRASNPASAG
jgi:hypothetical protein